jgi:predicted dehydrogenase
MDKLRRDFIKKTGIGTAALTIGGLAPELSSKSYGNVIGADGSINFAVAGVHSRGLAHIDAILALKNITIGYICDVDSKVAAAAVAKVEKATGKKPQIIEDFRKLVEIKDIDAVTIATPEHWHAPMAIIAAKAGKNVYCEKPVCHNLHEADLLIELCKKYPKLVLQYGCQGRSGTQNAVGIKDLKDGLIGKVYLAKAWYVSGRKGINKGKVVPVPPELNWELFQGPAPREDYRDNVVHYNWHWFQAWGTGELGNNGIHQLDNVRWALGIDYPEKVTSVGGRYHFDDDWQFPDSQIVTFTFPGNITVQWEGRSCNNYPVYDEPNGVMYSGTNGTIRILPENDKYVAYDMRRKVIKEFKGEEIEDANRMGGGSLDNKHFTNFAAAIRDGAASPAPLAQGAISTALCHLGNISQKLGRTLKVDPKTGKILGDAEAQKMATRKYQPGWEPKV